MKVETLRDDRDIRILRCREGNRIWYQMWVTKSDWYDIHNRCMINLYNIPIKYWWLRNLQQYYVFFYEKRGSRVRGVIGKEMVNVILGELL